MQLYSYEDIPLQGVPGKQAADMDFLLITAQGPVYPLIRLVLKARSYISQNPQVQYSVQPNRIFCELFIGQERPDTLIAMGESEQPLTEWRANYDQQVAVRFPLSDRAVQHIAESLRGDYVNAVVNIAGSATYQGAG